MTPNDDDSADDKACMICGTTEDVVRVATDRFVVWACHPHQIRALTHDAEARRDLPGRPDDPAKIEERIRKLRESIRERNGEGCITCDWCHKPIDQNTYISVRLVDLHQDCRAVWENHQTPDEEAGDE